MTDPDLSPAEMIDAMAAAARAAAAALARLPTERRRAGLRSAAAAIRAAGPTILEANDRDVAAGGAAGLSAAMLDRLRLDEGRVAAIAAAVEQVAALDDPVGQEIDRAVRPNGQIGRAHV